MIVIAQVRVHILLRLICHRMIVVLSVHEAPTYELHQIYNLNFVYLILGCVLNL
jgi:hypothetical protein